ncbi:uncharacterized protein [Equus asinus]|uniref:uncharacterized protein isoform X2 n=1 Tax=Equus asinus TaxID=9793 RepID=UPI0038F730E0
MLRRGIPGSNGGVGRLREPLEEGEEDFLPSAHLPPSDHAEPFIGHPTIHLFKRYIWIEINFPVTLSLDLRIYQSSAEDF